MSLLLRAASALQRSPLPSSPALPGGQQVTGSRRDRLQLHYLHTSLHILNQQMPILGRAAQQQSMLTMALEDLSQQRLPRLASARRLPSKAPLRLNRLLQPRLYQGGRPESTAATRTCLQLTMH